MIRCIRLWTGDDDESRFEEGCIALDAGPHGDLASGKVSATTVSFQETASGGTLDFETRTKRTFALRPGVVLLAEDTAGGGHSWRLIDAEPWRRIYVVLGREAKVPFQPVVPAIGA